VRGRGQKTISFLLILALLAGMFNVALPQVKVYADSAGLPNVITAAVVGDLQTELGAEADWDPSSPAAEMTFYDNGLFELIGVLPSGNYEYKIALNDSWTINYGAGNIPDGPNIKLSVPADGTKVIFQFDSVTNEIFDSINNPERFVTAALAGTIKTAEAPDGIGWTPENPETEMEYLGGGIFRYTAEVLAGVYEYKVALNDTWDVSFPEPNKELAVDKDQTVTFYYNHNTKTVKDTINDTITTVALVGTIQTALGGPADWDPAGDIAEMHDVDEDGIYMFQAYLPAGSYKYKVALNDDWGGDYPGSDIPLVVPEPGSTVLFLADNINKVVKDSINDVPTAVQRYILFKYLREDGNYDGWNIWVWNTGKKDGQIDFTEFKDGEAIAKIYLGNTASQVGFIVRKGDWLEKDIEYDRFIDTTGQVVTKVTVKSGVGEIEIVPKVTAPVIENGNVTFYYRDEELYQKNQMHTLAEGGNGVKLKFAGNEYPMHYNPKNEYFEYTVENIPYGIHEYTYVVIKDGNTAEIPDPMNTVDGVSRIVYIKPTATITSDIKPNKITYNENAVLSLEIELSQGTVQEIYADLTSLGGKSRTYIDTQLNALSIAVKDTVEPGIKEIPITVIDEYGNSHLHTAFVEIVERHTNGDSDFDWDEARIYFLLTDRFNDGDPENNNLYGSAYSEENPGAYYGGDFQGIIDKLDYLSELGINTIWISPIVDNIDYGLDTPEGVPYYAYHGYWAKNFEAIEEQFGDLESFKALIDAAHDKGIKIMVDVVLNHAGYGLKESDAGNGNGIPGYPTDEDRARFTGMFRTESEAGDIRSELAGLPDFKTEDAAVREQIIKWQVDWLNRARTDRGDTIDYFRVDTVKHVDDTTWKEFKNELTAVKPEFKLIGEWFGAGINNTGGQLWTGQMDSLLDFEFKSAAADFVNGKIDEAYNYLQNRGRLIDNTATLGQFLSSHDEDGFLVNRLNGDRGKMKVAAALQITSKGQPVIYYGEEIGLSGVNNYPYYDNRYVMPWDDIETDPVMKDFLNHYQKLLNIRADNSKVFSKGTSTKVAGGDLEGYLVVRRTYEDKEIYVALNTRAETANNVEIAVAVPDGSVFKDEYNGSTYTVENGKIVISIPGKDQGGTAILTTDASSNGVPPIPEGHIRIHYNRPNGDYAGYGLWIWDDVAEPSTNWPTGAIPFDPDQRDSYGVYLDIELKQNAKKIGFLVVDRILGDAGKDGGDKSFTIASPEMNEIWIKQGSDQVYKYEPVDLPENTVRIHYLREDGNYEPWGLWIWGDVATPSENNGSWPIGATPFSNACVDRYGTYIDIPLKDDAKELGLVVVNRENGQKDGNDRKFNLLDKFNRLWIRENDDTIYVSPYWEVATGLVYAEVVSDNKILLGFTMTEGLDEETLKNSITIADIEDNPVIISKVTITGLTTVELTANIDLNKIPLKVTYAGRTVSASTGWRMLDEMYAYDGDDLGATYMNGNALLKLWAPKASRVAAIFYDKDDPAEIIGRLELTRGDKGVWSVLATPEDFEGVEDLRGYFYQYEVTNDGITRTVLDPYAKSMAVFRVDTNGNAGPDGDTVGKAAIVDLSKTNPDNFIEANIKGYEKREDAIIWEVHVRDFTSDPSIEGDLNSRWGSYKAFIDKLDYIKSLGVTHIQLLPVMAWYYGDEAAMGERELEYSTKDNNYNWGYDPHGYFSPDGAYSENPYDPELRIRELKELINAIHEAGMGVILDVVYTHMAKTSQLNDIVPNYYAWQDENGNFIGGFGNNLATNRKMAEKLLVDSVRYWFSEYKIDGMRFDMMGDATYDAIQKAYNAAAEINPKALFIGEGWRTFSGHLSDPSLAGKGADQDWMDKTDDVAVFSDEIRNELKSGFGHEGEPRFITGGARDIRTIFNNIKGQPGNVKADAPGDVVQYIEAHDNLTLYDVIALSIKKDPKLPENDLEIHKRIRLGNTLILTSQGTAFLHAGQEYGRTKQWLGAGVPEHKYTELKDISGNVIGYLVHDSYDSSDAINMFDWAKATDAERYPVNDVTRRYTEGLIKLRKSTNAFRLGNKSLVDSKVTLINAPEIQARDLIIAYKCESTDGTGVYYVFVNADSRSRTLSLRENLTTGIVLVDNDEAGITEVKEKSGFELTSDSITLDSLTAVVIKKMPSAGGPSTSGPATQGSSGSPLKTELKVSENTATLTITVEAKNVEGGKALAALSQNQFIDAVNKAVKEASSQGENIGLEVELKVELPDGPDSIETKLPKDAARLLADSEIDSLKISTSIAAVAFDRNALDRLYQANEDITISVAVVDNSTLSEEVQKAIDGRPVFNFNVTGGDDVITEFEGTVTVTIPYAPREDEDVNSIVIYYINNEGKLEIVSNCVYDPSAGTVSFKTTHFSRYAVGYNKVTFKDVPENSWYKNAVEFIAARGITAGTGNNNFSPEQQLTRGQFLVMAMKAYGIKPDLQPADNFIDAGNTYYTGYLAAAKRLGITAGTGGNKYEPEKEITRQEMFTLLYNILKAINELPENTGTIELSDFADSDMIAPWAKEAMELFVKASVITGDGVMLNPDGKTNRAQMAQALYKLLSRQYQPVNR